MEAKARYALLRLWLGRRLAVGALNMLWAANKTRDVVNLAQSGDFKFYIETFRITFPRKVMSKCY